MIKSITRSISRKLMAVVLLTTFMALFVSAAAMLVYDIQTYQQSWRNDLTTQADLVARISAPALAFNDPKAAHEYLNLLRTRPFILAAAIYEPDGRMFASYFSGDGPNAEIPVVQEKDGYQVAGDRIAVFHRLEENGELVGTVYIQARYELMERLQNYLAILLTVMGASLVTAAIISTWLQAAFTKPILAVTRVAREVMQRRDFSLRVKKTTEDEIGVLVDAFNAMLNEVGRRAMALEESNRILENEMQERRSAEQALLVADRRKDEFLATLAHELRNPLAPLLNGLAILRMPNGNPATAERAREIMERQLRQMVRLVDDLLDVSRITTGKLAIREERVELQPLVQSAVELNLPLLEQRRHQLVVQVPDQPVWLDADPTRLSQVFSNLLNNAAKYTEPGGRIDFSAALEEGQVVIRVTDSGIGIRADMLSEIFEMFTQADYSLERINAGLGVGLTLARKLIELHGGTIQAQSAGQGLGSTFIVRLPQAAPLPAHSRPDSDTVGDRPDQLYRILLADDNVDFATSLATLLRALGHEVRITHNGADALAAAPDFNPEFAFLDIGLPGINGYELARRLRLLPAIRNCVLVAVTGWGQDKDKRLAQQAGFDHHMVKPVDPARIIALLRQTQG
jgi:signal transduction histidine kinase/ActR/RegA family two-component response regulator